MCWGDRFVLSRPLSFSRGYYMYVYICMYKYMYFTGPFRFDVVTFWVRFEFGFDLRFFFVFDFVFVSLRFRFFFDFHRSSQPSKLSNAGYVLVSHTALQMPPIPVASIGPLSRLSRLSSHPSLEITIHTCIVYQYVFSLVQRTFTPLTRPCLTARFTRYSDGFSKMRSWRSGE